MSALNSVFHSVALYLRRDEVGVVNATAGVDTLAVGPAVVDEIRQPEHRAKGHEAFPACSLLGLARILEPLGVTGMQSVSVFHDGDNLLVALGLVPGQAHVGDALLAQKLKSILVHG